MTKLLTPELDFLNSVMQSQTIEQVWEVHSQKMPEYGFDRMIYAANRLSVHGRYGDISDALLLTNHDAEYIERFFGDALYFNAPMAIWASQNTGVCSWKWISDQAEKDQWTEEQLKIIEYNKKMGVTAGYSISFKEVSSRSKAAIGLCARRDLSQADIDAMWKEKGTEITLLNEVVNLKISSLPFERSGNRLTDRQREVLEWVADGKTLRDIATLMNITLPTVEKHLRLARERLNAESTAQAVLRASIQNQFFLLGSHSSKR